MRAEGTQNAFVSLKKSFCIEVGTLLLLSEIGSEVSICRGLGGNFLVSFSGSSVSEKFSPFFLVKIPLGVLQAAV